MRDHKLTSYNALKISPRDTMSNDIKNLSMSSSSPIDFEENDTTHGSTQWNKQTLNSKENIG